MSFEEIVDGQISITIAHLEHFVLRWAKNVSSPFLNFVTNIKNIYNCSSARLQNWKPTIKIQNFDFCNFLLNSLKAGENLQAVNSWPIRPFCFPACSIEYCYFGDWFWEKDQNNL